MLFASWGENDNGESGKLYVLNAHGQLLFAVDLPAPLGGTWSGGLAAPTLADIDGDGELEVDRPHGRCRRRRVRSARHALRTDAVADRARQLLARRRRVQRAHVRRRIRRLTRGFRGSCSATWIGAARLRQCASRIRSSPSRNVRIACRRRMACRSAPSCASSAASSTTRPRAGRTTASTPGTRWEDVPETWTCPDCGVTKSRFRDGRDRLTSRRARAQRMNASERTRMPCAARLRARSRHRGCTTRWWNGRPVYSMR